MIKLPWTYTSQSTVVLLASQHASKVVGGNPYLAFDSSLTLTADVVRREVMDPRTGQDLAKRGYTASYAVVDAPDTSGPVLADYGDGQQQGFRPAYAQWGDKRGLDQAERAAEQRRTPRCRLRIWFSR